MRPNITRQQITSQSFALFTGRIICGDRCGPGA
jgi:hypothetical protein